MSATLFTIGHSNHPFDRFLDLVRMHSITAVGDVRSTPYSRHNPQYNRETLQQGLRQAGIAYLFLGAELGARCPDPACYEGGAVVFSRVARTAPFLRGLELMRSAMASHRLALMCAEKDPLMCHRTALISRILRKGSFDIVHILADGSVETQAELDERLLRLMKVAQADLFLDREALIEQAYEMLARRMTAPRGDAQDPSR